MRFICLLTSLALVASSVSATCLCDDNAGQVAANFQALIANYSDELANATLTEDFHDYSDSVIELINSGCTTPVALGSPTFDSRASFEVGQGAQPPIPFEILNIWNSCTAVTMRWRTTVAPEAPQLVTGIVVLEVIQAPEGSQYPWLIQMVYSEFNSGAWLVDLGIFSPTCPPATP